jgi:uncharacterized protein (DUF1499 family)
MIGMFSKLNRLRSLEISRSLGFVDKVLEAVAYNCPCLRVLNVSRTGITDMGIESLANNSLSLIALDISFTNVSSSSILKMSFQIMVKYSL